MILLEFIDELKNLNQYDKLERKVFNTQKGDRYVYILKDSQYINTYKIGISYDVNQRIEGIYAQSNCKLDLIKKYLINGSIYVSAKQIEMQLHKYYKHRNLHHEWFMLNDSDLNDIDLFFNCLYQILPR